jgi:outer membrane protein OmpA-like peptidoglycan-associated protein
MRLLITLVCLTFVCALSAQRNQKKLETSFDFGIGNHFGLRQIEDGYSVNTLALSNYTLGWNNYFTNYKIGGRLEMSYDRMSNSSSSASFLTNYYRATYYLNASLKNLFGWGQLKKTNIDKKSFNKSFDIDLSAGLGYSAMKNSNAPISESPFLKGADDMLNFSFRIAPSLDLGDGIKLFASYTRINHSAQSNSFDFTESISNTAFKGAFRTFNVGIRYTPQTERVFSRKLREDHKKFHFITAIDASIGNHFAGSTSETTTKFRGAGINHFNIGAIHKYPNSKLKGRFDIGYDVFSELKGESDFRTKYFRTTYQIIADLSSLSPYQGQDNKFNLSFGAGLGFATMYNDESSNGLSDIFLNGDDMYALVFSVNPSYKITKYLSLISNLTFTSHSLQSSNWNLQDGQTNSALNGRFMNMSLGLRFNLSNRRAYYTSEIVNRIPRVWTIDAAVGNHFAGTPIADNYDLKTTPGKHLALGLNHPFINPIYFGRFEFAFDDLGANSSSVDFSSNYFRLNYFLMTSVQNQLRQALSSERPARKFDVQFGLGLGASTFKGDQTNDYFITKGDDMLNIAAKIVPTYQITEKLSAFAAYTFISHSFQSKSYDMSESVEKKSFNGRLMNASVGLSYNLKSSKRRVIIPITPVDTETKLVVVDPTPESVIESTPVSNVVVEPTPEPVVETSPQAVAEPTPQNVVKPAVEQAGPVRVARNPIEEYPLNASEVPESQKKMLKDLAFELKSNKFLTLIVSGHTDNSGTPEFNLTLSRKRAASVKAFLISQGVSPERVKIEYYGTTRPVATNDTTEGRNKNRRVDIEIVKD